MVDLPHYWGIVFPRMCGNPNHMFNLSGSASGCGESGRPLSLPAIFRL